MSSVFSAIGSIGKSIGSAFGPEPSIATVIGTSLEKLGQIPQMLRADDPQAQLQGQKMKLLTAQQAKSNAQVAGGGSGFGRAMGAYNGSAGSAGTLGG